VNFDLFEDPSSWPAFPAAGFRTGIEYNFDVATDDETTLKLKMVSCLDSNCSVSSDFIFVPELMPNACTRAYTEQFSAFCVQLLPTTTSPTPPPPPPSAAAAATLTLAGQVAVAMLLGALSGAAVYVFLLKRGRKLSRLQLPPAPPPALDADDISAFNVVTNFR
jgi:hypothetical protein